MSYVYELPLATWISMALHKDKLASLAAAIRENKLPSLLEKVDGPSKDSTSANRAYINKVLQEEVIKQFSEEQRPMLEVILNSVDAKPVGLKGEYRITVSVGRRNFTSADNGSGMSLEDILQLLIIPFHTNKEGIDEIGRFGVGFLSCLNYCLVKPEKAYVALRTRNGTEGYLLKFYAERNFYGDEEGRVQSLRMALKKESIRNPPGTLIVIRKSPTARKRAIREYLMENVKGIQPYKAKIYLNGELANDHSKLRWYSEPVELHLPKRTITGEAGIQIDFNLLNIFDGTRRYINLVSQGVLVRKLQGIDGIDSTVSFPAGVQVVEGRDEFKIDGNYNRAVDAIFRAVESYLCEEQERISTMEKKKEEEALNLINRFTRRMAAFIPDLAAALGRQKLSEIPNLEGLQKVLLPGKEYVLLEQDMERFKQFFGGWLEETAFDALYGGHSHWKELYREAPQLLQDKAPVVESLPPERFREKIRHDPSYYPNTIVVAGKLKMEDYSLVRLVDVFPSGRSGLMIYNQELFINVQHPYVKGAFNPSKAYALIADFCELPDVRVHNHSLTGAEVERLIQDIAGKFLTREAWEEKRLGVGNMAGSY